MCWIFFLFLLTVEGVGGGSIRTTVRIWVFWSYTIIKAHTVSFLIFFVVV